MYYQHVLAKKSIKLIFLTSLYHSNCIFGMNVIAFHFSFLYWWSHFFIFAFAWKAKHFTFATFFQLLLHNFWGISGNSEQKHFTDHQTTNKSHIYVAIKGNFASLFFSWLSRSKGEFPRDYLINIATCFFANY